MQVKELLTCVGNAAYPDVCLKFVADPGLIGYISKKALACGSFIPTIVANATSMTFETPFVVAGISVAVGGFGDYLLSGAAATLRNCGVTVVTQVAKTSAYYLGAELATAACGGAAVLGTIAFFGLRKCRRKTAEQTPLTNADNTNDLELASTAGFQANAGQ